MIIGLLGAFVALSTGYVAAEQNRDALERNVLQAHENFAVLTTTAYGILAASYIILLLSEFYPSLKDYSLFRLLSLLEKFFIETPFKYILVIIGLIAITITGALGGAMVYGPGIDPVVTWIYNMVV